MYVCIQSIQLYDESDFEFFLTSAFNNACTYVHYTVQYVLHTIYYYIVSSVILYPQ